MDILMEHVGHGIGLILLLSLPITLLAAGIGLIVGILQAVTQVQEQTISAAPKIAFVFMFIIVSGPFTIQMLEEYTRESVHLGMDVVAHDEAMVLPPKPRLAYGEANSRFDFFKENKPSSGSKIHAMMATPSKASGIMDQDTGVANYSHPPKPKPGVSEQIYLHRRHNGTLPPPPKPNDRF